MPDNQERWLPVVGYDGFYEVSDDCQWVVAGSLAPAGRRICLPCEAVLGCRPFDTGSCSCGRITQADLRGVWDQQGAYE